jgi:WD40 repeat protein
LKRTCRGRKLVVCLREENRLAILDLDSKGCKASQIDRPWRSASSHHLIAVTTFEDGIHLLSLDGFVVHIIPDSTDANCVAFHPGNTSILAIGCTNGSVYMWDVSTQAYVTSFTQRASGIANARFTPDCRLFLSSWDGAASIVKLDDQFQYLSSVKLEGHTGCINDLLPILSSNQCVTGSNDKTIKVWHCETGTCLRTLTEHTDWVTSFAMHPYGKHFASGSHDKSVIIWCCETFEVLRRITFHFWVQSLVLGASDILYVGVYKHGVLSCNAFTGEVGQVTISGPGNILGLSLGRSLLLYCTKQTTPHSHS